MKKIMFLMVFVALLVVPIASYAETLEECESKCIDLCHHWDNDEDFNGCMRVCMAQCKPGKPTSSHNLLVPSKSDLNNPKTCAEVEANEEIDITNLIFASLADDKDLPCYAGGKHVANCSRGEPYYNVLDGECYSTLNKCKEANGDLNSPYTSGGCVRCGR